MTLYNLPDITAAHQFLVELEHYVEAEDGDLQDSHLERLQEVFEMTLDKEDQLETESLLDKLRTYIKLSFADLERQGKQHLTQNR